MLLEPTDMTAVTIGTQRLRIEDIIALAQRRQEARLSPDAACRMRAAVTDTPQNGHWPVSAPISARHLGQIRLPLTSHRLSAALFAAHW